MIIHNNQFGEPVFLSLHSHIAHSPIRLSVRCTLCTVTARKEMEMGGFSEMHNHNPNVSVCSQLLANQYSLFCSL